MVHSLETVTKKGKRFLVLDWFHRGLTSQSPFLQGQPKGHKVISGALYDIGSLLFFFVKFESFVVAMFTHGFGTTPPQCMTVAVMFLEILFVLLLAAMLQRFSGQPLIGMS